MSPDVVEMVSALRDARADYLVVRAHARRRWAACATGDLDIWVRATLENPRWARSGLKAFGAPLAQLSVQDFASPDTVFQIGIEPNRTR